MSIIQSSNAFIYIIFNIYIFNKLLHGRAGKPPGSRPEPPLEQFEDDELQLPIIPQISRMIIYVLYKAYLITPCEYINRVKLIETSTGGF